MFHTVAFYESVDPAGAYNTLNGVPDQTVYVSGVDIRVPKPLPYIIGAAGLGNDASFVAAQVQSPSMRSFTYLDVTALKAALVFAGVPHTSLNPGSPIPVAPDEAINFAANSDPAAAAVHYGLVTFSDGPVQPVRGNMRTVRCTGAAALAAGAWKSSVLTFGQTLPVGQYQVVGMRAEGANLVAARLVFNGTVWRPGVPAANAVGDDDRGIFRFGNAGIFGQFDSTTPPQIECLGVTDTAQVVQLDLLRVG
jgi:hypothetical protein